MQRVNPVSIIVYLKVNILFQEFGAVNFFVKKVVAKGIFTKDRVIMLLLLAVDELV